MKRLFSAALAACLTVSAAAGLQAQATTKNAGITLAKARAIALAHVPHNEGVTSSKLKHKNGMDVYEFDIETPGPGHHEVRVDATTGKIVSSSHEDDIIGKTSQKVSSTAKGAAKDAKNAVDRVFNKDEWAKQNPAISESRARSIAQQQYPNAPIKDVDLETKHGILVWEIDLDTPGAGHDEVLVDATSGDVLRKKHREDFVNKTLDKIKK